MPPSANPDQTHMNGTRKKAYHERVVAPAFTSTPSSRYQAPGGGFESGRAGPPTASPWTKDASGQALPQRLQNATSFWTLTSFGSMGAEQSGQERFTAASSARHRGTAPRK